MHKEVNINKEIISLTLKKIKIMLVNFRNITAILPFSLLWYSLSFALYVWRDETIVTVPLPPFCINLLAADAWLFKVARKSFFNNSLRFAATRFVAFAEGEEGSSLFAFKLLRTISWLEGRLDEWYPEPVNGFRFTALLITVTAKHRF